MPIAPATPQAVEESCWRWARGSSPSASSRRPRRPSARCATTASCARPPRRPSRRRASVCLSSGRAGAGSAGIRAPARRPREPPAADLARSRPPARAVPRTPGCRGRSAPPARPGARSRPPPTRAPDVDRDPDQHFEPPQQRERRLRVRGRGDVVGHRRPQARRGQAGVGAGRVQHADDPRRAFVAGVPPEALEQRRVGGVAGHRHRAGVGNVAEQRAERDHELHAQRLGQIDDVRAKAPAHRGLDPLDQHQVARRARGRASKISTVGQMIWRCRSRRARSSVGWPGSRRTPPGRCCAKRRAFSEEARNESALEAASPASFQPLNAHTIAGALRPSGRRSQIRGCIRPPYIMGRSLHSGPPDPVRRVHPATAPALQAVSALPEVPNKEGWLRSPRQPPTPAARPARIPRPVPAPAAVPNKGLYPPRHPGRSSRMIGEVVVDLGLRTTRPSRTPSRPPAPGPSDRPVLVERGILRHDQLARVVAERFGWTSSTCRSTTSTWARSTSSAGDRQALPGGSRRLRRGRRAAGRDGQPHQRAHDRRHRDDDRPAHPPGAASVEDSTCCSHAWTSMDESIEDIVDEEEETAPRTAARRGRQKTRRSSSSCTRSSPRRSSRAPPTSTSTPRRETRACMFRVDGVLTPARP